MKDDHRFIEQLRSGESIEQVFLVRDKDLRTTKNGDLYITCTLVDRTGSLPARLWQATESIHAGIPADGFLLVKGRVEDYKGNLQCIIDGCRPVPPEKVDLADYIATTPHDVEEMWSEMMEILRAVKNKHLLRLIKKFMEDRKLIAAVKRAPAAMQMHHAYVGGLVEHTLGVMRAAVALLPLYPRLSADLVLTGAFLHDIGKCAELAAETAIHYTDRGQLVGHITIAAIWVTEKAAAVAAEHDEAIPHNILNVLQHIILSHHGVFEYGSPKLPAVPEAFFINYLDNLDAKMWMTTRAIDGDPDETSNFTSKVYALETRVYKKSGDI